MPAVIRPADETDAGAITSVLVASRAAAMPYLPRLYDDEQTGAFITHVVLLQCRVWVAESSQTGEVVGFAALEDDLLEHLYLRPDVQRQGVGTHLLDEARAASPAGLTLRVFTRNTAARVLRTPRLRPTRRERRQPQRGERAGHDLYLVRSRLMQHGIARPEPRPEHSRTASSGAMTGPRSSARPGQGR